jgi:hypothetical protein
MNTTKREPTFAELLAIALRSEPAPKGEWLPTSAPPGSPEKVEVLRERLGLGQPLFHPNDAAEGYQLRDRARRPVSPETLAKAHQVAEGLRVGLTYRQMAAQLGCWYSYITTLAKLARRLKLTA